MHEKDQKWLRQLFEKQKKDLKPFELKLRINSPKMRTIWVSLASQAILGSEEVFCGRRMLLRDITSQISEQRQKLNPRRIEALNLFNTGVSHYFGNLLQTVLAKAEMGLERLALDDPARDCLMQVKEVVFKGNALNQRMLAITGGAVAMEMPLNLKQLVGEMLPELNRRAGPNLELELDLDHQFFSTKFINRGLGLAEILGVVRAHKGAVKLDSRPEFGCTATLFLPASKG